MSALTDRERAVLDFEGKWWKFAGAKDAAIREQFGVSPTRYYAALSALMGRPEALAYAPGTVRRVQRLAEQRRKARGY